MSGTKSDAAWPLTAIVTCLILDTFDATVNELLTLAPAKLSNAWKLDVALRPLSDLDITIAIVFP